MVEWTVKKVKDELPNVSILLKDGRVETGWVGGKAEAFGVVFIPSMAVGIEFSWSTIAKALNDGTYLQV